MQMRLTNVAAKIVWQMNAKQNFKEIHYKDWMTGLGSEFLSSLALICISAKGWNMPSACSFEANNYHYAGEKAAPQKYRSEIRVWSTQLLDDKTCIRH